MNNVLPRRLAAALLLGMSLLVASGCASSRTKESAGEYVDDAAVTASVRSALIGDSEIKSNDINIETYRGNVQLSGFVNNQTQIDRAVAVARKQNGVKAVKNDLRIKTN